MTENVIQMPPRTNPRSRRGCVYRGKAQRAAADELPPAWTIGDRKSFLAARQNALKAIRESDRYKNGEKVVLFAILDRLNEKDRWSSFASAATNAAATKLSSSTVWRAIGKAEGVDILTKTMKRPNGTKRYRCTHVTIHPNHVARMRPSSSNHVAQVTQTTSHGCSEPPRTDARRTTSSEPSSSNHYDRSYPMESQRNTERAFDDSNKEEREERKRKIRAMTQNMFNGSEPDEYDFPRRQQVVDDDEIPF